MSMISNGSAGWRNVVIAILTSILLTGGAAWSTIGTNAVRRDELLELRRSVETLREAVNQLQTAIAVLNARLEKDEPTTR